MSSVVRRAGAVVMEQKLVGRQGEREEVGNKVCWDGEWEQEKMQGKVLLVICLMGKIST
jgi:hypothetical protein